MFFSPRPQATVGRSFNALKRDARQWLRTVQNAAALLKSSLHADGKAEAVQGNKRGKTGKDADPAAMLRALRDYHTHEEALLEDRHQTFRIQLASIAEPLDALLTKLASQQARNVENSVWRTDAARDWLRRLYGLEKLEEAMYLFFRAEVAFRAARMGLDLLCPPQKIAELERRGNELNRSGVNALFHLRDQLLEQLEAYEDRVQPDLDAEDAAGLEPVIGREALRRTLIAALDAHKVLDEPRYLLENAAGELRFPPFEIELEDSLELLIELTEMLGTLRQSRERGWYPDEPRRGVQGTAVSIWLLYLQAATAVFYAACREARADGEIDPEQLASSLRQGLTELLVRWSLHSADVQHRLSQHV